jgi:hypothetical protein
MKILCMGIILMCVLIIVIGIITVHELPGKIARRRGHPQAEAIRICSLLGLIVFPFWMMALLWAYMRPVFTPLPLENIAAEADVEGPQALEGGDV